MVDFPTGKRLTTPFEAPIKNPWGPFFELVQPGTGSCHAAVTVYFKLLENLLKILLLGISKNMLKVIWKYDEST